MPTETVDWAELQQLANKLQEPGRPAGQFDHRELIPLENSLRHLQEDGDDQSLIKLREMFAGFILGESYGGLPVVDAINSAAIQAAERLGDLNLAGQYLFDLGNKLHQIGRHKEAIETFEKAANLVVYVNILNTEWLLCR